MNNIYLIVHGDSFLASDLERIVFFTEESIRDLPSEYFQKHHFLTHAENQYFLLEVTSEFYLPQLKSLGDDWVKLRSLLGSISENDFQLIGRAQQILRWHREHQYCGQCGAATKRKQPDFAMFCSVCNLDFYPKISPCIIVLVTRGQECLLARHSRSSSVRYSCLAGFIEAGETPEQTLVREVMEEVGINVHNLRYVASQAWPFPGQLMLGFVADYLDGELVVDNNEIVAADWFNKDQLPEIPPAGTISRKLIDYFFDQKKIQNK